MFEISDTVTILRDGHVVHDGLSSEMTTDSLIKSMVGREVADIFPPRNAKIATRLSLRQTSALHRFLKNVSIQVRRGEIVGLFGLSGAGRTELLRAVYGADPIKSGDIRVTPGNRW